MRGGEGEWEYLSPPLAGRDGKSALAGEQPSALWTVAELRQGRLEGRYFFDALHN